MVIASRERENEWRPWNLLSKYSLRNQTQPCAPGLDLPWKEKVGEGPLKQASPLHRRRTPITQNTAKWSSLPLKTKGQRCGLQHCQYSRKKESNPSLSFIQQCFPTFLCHGTSFMFEKSTQHFTQQSDPLLEDHLFVFSVTRWDNQLGFPPPCWSAPTHLHSLLSTL